VRGQLIWIGQIWSFQGSRVADRELPPCLLPDAAVMLLRQRGEAYEGRILTMKASILAVVAGGLLLQGCAGLILRDQDSVGMKTAKVVARVLFAVPTFLMSEVGIGTIEQREEREASQQQAQLSQRNHFDGLVGRLSYSDALVRWGPPAQSQAHGGMIIAVWQSRRASPGYLLMPPIPGNPWSSSLAVAIPEGGSRLQLVFDRETELLRSWSTQDW